MSEFTKNMLLTEWKSNVVDIIEEVIRYDFEEFDGVLQADIDTDQVNEIVGERLWERIDGDHDVIYTYNAKQVCDVLDYDIFEADEMTGERAGNWSQAAFMAIYNMIQNEFDIDKMIGVELDNHYNNEKH